MSEVPINNGTIDISHTLLGQIQQHHDKAFELLLNDEHIGKSRVHLCFVLIEQGLYENHMEKFLDLPRTIEQKGRIRDHAMQIRARLNYYYPDKAAGYMKHLIENLFPEQAQLAKLLLAQKDPTE